MSDIKREETIMADNASAIEANMKGASENPLAPGTEKRIAVEKKLKRKLDLRCVVKFFSIDVRLILQVLALCPDLHPQLPRPKQHCRCPSTRSRSRPQFIQDRILDMSQYSLRRLHLDAGSLQYDHQ